MDPVTSGSAETGVLLHAQHCAARCSPMPGIALPWPALGLHCSVPGCRRSSGTLVGTCSELISSTCAMMCHGQYAGIHLEVQVKARWGRWGGSRISWKDAE